MHRFFRFATGAVVVLALFSLSGCHHVATTQPNLIATHSTLSPIELRGALASLANSHGDKIKLALWVSTPLRPVDAPFRPFFNNMGVQNRRLFVELQDWAKQHQIDLTYHLPAGIAGAAEKIMNDRQEKLVRNDGKLAFQHHILVQMYIDYESNLSLCQALLPTITDPALKAYVEKTAKMYADGSAEILALLARYKFQ